MIQALLVGLVVGFILAIPPGPIGVAVVKYAVAREFRAGGELAAGASLIDGVYATAAVFASSTIVSALEGVLTRNRFAALAFQIVSIVALVLLAVHYWRAPAIAAPTSARFDAVKRNQEERARRLGFARPFVVGILISFTNLASPTLLPSLVFLSGYLGSTGWLPAGVASRFAFSFAFAVGSLGWFLVLLRILHGMRDRLSANVTSMMNRFAGGAFLLFAIVLAFKVVVAELGKR